MDYQSELQQYLSVCAQQKHLDAKTVKAYRIDIRQFLDFMAGSQSDLTRGSIEKYISILNQTYKPRSVMRKIASVKGFSSFLAERYPQCENPFLGMRIKITQRKTLPRIIPLRVINAILQKAHEQDQYAKTNCQCINAAREAAILELLFATGLRVSELCGIENKDMNLREGYVLVHGKGNKERVIDIENPDVIQSLEKYRDAEKAGSPFFFQNRSHRKLSDQSVRRIVNKYAELVLSEQHITPHMFRHSFATYLLDEGWISVIFNSFWGTALSQLRRSIHMCQAQSCVISLPKNTREIICRLNNRGVQSIRLHSSVIQQLDNLFILDIVDISKTSLLIRKRIIKKRYIVESKRI